MVSAGNAERQCLTTPRLSLRPLSPADAPALYPLLNDWRVVSMLANVRWPVTPAGVAAFASAATTDTEADSLVILAEESPVGSLAVKRPGSGEPPRTMPRLGYWIGRRFWNRGLATEAVAAAVDHAFLRYLHDVVGAGVFCDNPASARVLGKLGFHEVGRYETPCLSRGAAVLTRDMQLARNDWTAMRA